MHTRLIKIFFHKTATNHIPAHKSGPISFPTSILQFFVTRFCNIKIHWNYRFLSSHGISLIRDKIYKIRSIHIMHFVFSVERARPTCVHKAHSFHGSYKNHHSCTSIPLFEFFHHHLSTTSVYIYHLGYLQLFLE